ncbi:MAG: hypothetical protein ACTTKN_06750 [Phocaeicola sp.]|uniref:hypothetical protein n=1 Tax=Phocaeicola TaxID=909656 RepID=UPI00234EEB50|nr:hypothetical protein [Phocaeicola oris]MCE2616724.1 hypothetical protein [Phocaeicola oris]
MATERRYQREITTGRGTLPVTILLCLILWSIHFKSFSYFASFAIYALVGYLLIELNTTFSIIRTRTTMPVALYWLIMAICLFFHPFNWVNITPLAFIIAIFQLFITYERKNSTKFIFNTFFIISAGSIAFPPLLYLIIPFFIGMKMFRSLTRKTFFVAILGLLFPYWFLFCYAFLTDQLNVFKASIHSLYNFSPIIYSGIHIEILAAVGIITFFSLIGTIHYLMVSYQDKTQTRIYYSFFILLEVCIYILGTLQPQHLYPLLLMQTIIMSILVSHLIVLSRTRFSSIMLIATFIILTVWALFEIWMLSFNS